METTIGAGDFKAKCLQLRRNPVRRSLRNPHPARLLEAIAETGREVDRALERLRALLSHQQ
jgi:hypothetical protein